MHDERDLPLMLRAAYMAMHRRTDASLNNLGVTADQFVLMLALDEEHALTQRELAERISSDPSTVRAMLVLLDKQGLVKRSSHPTDSRAKMVSLTTAGKHKLRSLWRASQPVRDEMQRMSRHEVETLITLLQQVAYLLQSKEISL